MHIRRDKRLIAAMFGMPLVQLLLFSYALSFDIKNISTAVVDHDRTYMSRKYVGAFTNSGYFKVNLNLQNYRQVDGALDAGTAKVVVVIPPGFARRLAANQTVAVQVLVDGSEPNTAIVARNFAAATTQQFSRNLILRAIERRGSSNGAVLSPLEPRGRIWYNPAARSVVFILPGLIVVIMTNMAVIQTTLAVVREKDHGTIEQLIVSPVHSSELMIGKILPFSVLAMLSLIIVTAVGIIGFAVPMRGSPVLLLLGSTLFTFAALGLGLLISAVSKTMETASQLSFFVSMLPAFILSGFIWPLENMPKVLQIASYLFPARYFMTIVRSIFLKGAGADILWPQFLALAGFAVAAMTLAALTLRERIG